jgi:hypothetical protein
MAKAAFSTAAWSLARGASAFFERRAEKNIKENFCILCIATDAILEGA